MMHTSDLASVHRYAPSIRINLYSQAYSCCSYVSTQRSSVISSIKIGTSQGEEKKQGLHKSQIYQSKKTDAVYKVDKDIYSPVKGQRIEYLSQAERLLLCYIALHPPRSYELFRSIDLRRGYINEIKDNHKSDRRYNPG